ARMTIANMTTEWGALAGVFPFDEITVNYLRSRVSEFSNPNRPGKRGPKSRSGYTNIEIDEWWKLRDDFSADPDAEYAIELELDLATVVPHVSGPNEVKTMVSLPEMQRKRVPIQTAMGRHSWARAPSRSRRAAARASVSAAVSCKKVRPRSARPIAISKAGWATATHSFISLRPRWSPPARSPGSFARRPISPKGRPARRCDARKRRQDRHRRLKSWKASLRMCADGFFSSTK